MAKGYLVDDAQRCIRFRIPGSGKHVKFAISFDTLIDCFGVIPSAQAFAQNRKSIHNVAERLVSGRRPADADGWIWIQSADC